VAAGRPNFIVIEDVAVVGGAAFVIGNFFSKRIVFTNI